MSEIHKIDNTNIAIADEAERLVEGWGCVNVVDKVGELVPVDRVAELMPIYMSRGGTLVDSHTGRHIGSVLKWERRRNEIANADGIYLYCKVFKGLRIDDAIWKFIQEGKYQGFSIGGKDFGKEMECDEQRCYNKIKDMEFWEFSLVPSPANKSAWITDFSKVAKEDNLGLGILEKLDKSVFKHNLIEKFNKV